MPTSFENEVVGWLPDGGQNQAQIFESTAPLNQLRYVTLRGTYDKNLSNGMSP